MPFGIKAVEDSKNNPAKAVEISKTANRSGSASDFAERAFDNISSSDLPADKSFSLLFNRDSKKR